MAEYYIVFFIPILLFLAGFSYQTWLSLSRLKQSRRGRANYTRGNWELLYLLLLYGVAAYILVFAQDLVRVADWLFWPAFVGAIAFGLRGVLYLYLFYGRANQTSITWLDWVFSVLHIIAVASLTVCIVQATFYVQQESPLASTQFYSVLNPGLFVVLALSIIPMLSLHKPKA